MEKKCDCGQKRVPGQRWNDFDNFSRWMWLCGEVQGTAEDEYTKKNGKLMEQTLRTREST